VSEEQLQSCRERSRYHEVCIDCIACRIPGGVTGGLRYRAPGLVQTTVNLREGPGTYAAILGKIPGGSSVEVTTCTGEWCHVSFQAKSGYVIATSLSNGVGSNSPAGSLQGAPPRAMLGRRPAHRRARLLRAMLGHPPARRRARLRRAMAGHRPPTPIPIRRRILTPMATAPIITATAPMGAGVGAGIGSLVGAMLQRARRFCGAPNTLRNSWTCSAVSSKLT
jgi:hypothetical protein